MNGAIPELRTSRGTALALCAAAIFALLVSFTIGGSIDGSLGSDALAVGVLGAWCLSGALAGIVGVVDAYTRPEGELLGLIFSIAATVFAIITLIVAVALLFTVGESVLLEIGD